MVRFGKSFNCLGLISGHKLSMCPTPDISFLPSEGTSWSQLFLLYFSALPGSNRNFWPFCPDPLTNSRSCSLLHQDVCWEYSSAFLPCMLYLGIPLSDSPSHLFPKFLPFSLLTYQNGALQTLCASFWPHSSLVLDSFSLLGLWGWVGWTRRLMTAEKPWILKDKNLTFVFCCFCFCFDNRYLMV